jgi:uncharacterized membrane protein (UPF0127 family)
VTLAIAAIAACSAGEPTPTGGVDPRLARTAVGVGGETLDVEIAIDPLTRFRGLSGRPSIPRNGGMLFVLPAPRPMSMVMRDCPVAIDVAFADSLGRVVAIHAMVPEPPRHPEETPFAYERRLPEYPSEAPIQFALETAGGRLAELGLQVGDRLHFAARELVERAQRSERPER